MGKVVAIILAATFIGACATDHDGQRREQYLATNPELKPTAIGNAISNGEIFEGMTEPEVAASWGEPCNILRNEAGELWDYCSYGEDHYVHFNESGRVVNFADYK
jgi:hypothetical protein